MELENIKISKIKVEGRFREDLGNLEELVEVIKQKGFIAPIIIDQKSRLLAGQRRLEAAAQAGLEVIPAVRHTVADEVDAREIELIENAVRKDFTWVERSKLEAYILKLKKETDKNWGVKDQAAYLKQSVGATSRRLNLATVLGEVPELAKCKTEDEAWKAWKRLQEEVVTASMRDKAGAKYKEAVKYASDHYRIGDAIQGLKDARPGTAHFIEVDPPYSIDLHKVKGRNVRARTDNYNEIPRDEYGDFLERVTQLVYRVAADNSFCVWWYGFQWYAQVLLALKKAGFQVNHIPAIWNKGIAGQTSSPDTMLGSAYEPFLIARKGQPKLAKPGRSNVFDFAPVAPQNKVHPTERPLELMRSIVGTFTFPGTVICVPFLGSGVTLRAGYFHKCTGYGWELDDMCKERFLNAVQRDRDAEDESGGG